MPRAAHGDRTSQAAAVVRLTRRVRRREHRDAPRDGRGRLRRPRRVRVACRRADVRPPARHRDRGGGARRALRCAHRRPRARDVAAGARRALRRRVGRSRVRPVELPASRTRRARSCSSASSRPRSPRASGSRCRWTRAGRSPTSPTVRRCSSSPAARRPSPRPRCSRTTSSSRTSSTRSSSRRPATTKQCCVAVPPFHIAGVTAMLSSTYAGRRIVPLPTIHRRGLARNRACRGRHARVRRAHDARPHRRGAGGQPRCRALPRSGTSRTEARACQRRSSSARCTCSPTSGS